MGTHHPPRSGWCALSILTLDEAKQQLNIPTDRTSSDEEITAYIDAVTDAVEGIVGSVDATAVTQTTQARNGVLVLDRLPVVSVTAATDVASQAAVDTSGWVVDSASGVVSTTTGGSVPTGVLRVSYLTGRAAQAAGVDLAARIIVQHLWQTQRGPSARTRSAPEDVSVVPGFAFAVPNRAVQLLERYRSLPGVA